MIRSRVRMTAVLFSLGATATFAASARAHICNVDLSRPIVTSTCGDPDNPDDSASFTPTQVGKTVKFTDGSFTGYGWIAGTNATLGDSHEIDDAKAYVFRLQRASLVTISFANDPSNPTPLDPAFSLYAGILPNEAHDDTAFDPLNPVDDINFLPVASPTDTAPNPFHHYFPLDRWRDTLHYSQTGGLDATGSPVHPFVGQFNALNDFSMANPDADPGQDPAGDWGTINYITHQNRFGAGRTETLTILLPRGDYTVIAGGANCNDDNPASACRLAAPYSGTVSVTAL